MSVEQKQQEPEGKANIALHKIHQEKREDQARHQGRLEVRLGAALAATVIGLWRSHGLVKGRLGDTVKSDRFVFFAFNVFESAVNASAAFFLLAAPSYTASLLSPTIKDHKALEHPATRFCLRLFGATEFLMASLFAFALKPSNAKPFLRIILGGDVLRLVLLLGYLADKPTNIIGPAVITHFGTIFSVILAKLVYLY